MENSATQIVSMYAEHGLAGLVIICLLAMMFLFGKWFAKHMEQMARLHRDERAEWRATVKEVTDMQDNRQKETNTILRDLARVIEGRLFQSEMPKIGRARK